MKKTLTLLTVSIMLLGTASAVVGHNGSDGELSITSGGSSSSSSSVAAGPNGTEWRATVEMTGRDTNASAGISSVNYSEEDYRKVEFDGVIEAPTPCHVLDHNLDSTGEDSFRLNVQTAKEELEGNNTQTCAQVITSITYDASFQTEERFTLEVQHNNQTVETLEYSEEEEKNSPIYSILDWLSNLF